MSKLIEIEQRKDILPVGVAVEVRRYEARNTGMQWGQWTLGVVRKSSIRKDFFGRELHLYWVETGNRFNTRTQVYLPAREEVRDGLIYAPSETLDSWQRQLVQYPMVLASAQLEDDSSNTRCILAWQAARLLVPRLDPDPLVVLQSGPKIGDIVAATNIAQYDAKTIEKLKKENQMVLMDLPPNVLMPVRLGSA